MSSTLVNSSGNATENIPVSTFYLIGTDTHMIASQCANVVAFTGVTSTERFETTIFGAVPVVNMLIEAVNNRTRERNYFRKYSELLEGIITDEEFDKELVDNEEEYVVSSHIKPSTEELTIALQLADRIKDVENTEDLASLFSFDSTHLDKLALSK